MAEKKKKKWIKKRHAVISYLAALVLYPYSKLVYHIKIDKFKQQNGRQYLILMNHQTAFDQFFVGLSFKGPIYYVASEDIFSKGWVSDLIRFIVAPIPFKKSVADIRGVRSCIRVAKEGGTIALSPEGNRTYSGRTGYIKPSIASLVKALKLPVAFYRISGGFGTFPRWSDVVRRGKMNGYVNRVLEYEEYKDLPNDQLLEIIKQELYVDEAKEDISFYHKKSAEYIERAMYICPYCGLSEFYSKDDIFECKSCKRQVRYLPSKKLEGIGFDFPFKFLADWYDWQCDYVREIDLTKFLEKPAYSDTVKFSKVFAYKNKQILSDKALLSLYGDKYTVKVGEEKLNYLFDDITAATVLGKNKLNFYIKGDLYQVKGDKRFNALKYLNLYYHYVNNKKANSEYEFLGL